MVSILTENNEKNLKSKKSSLKKKFYKEELLRLQEELVKMQYWIKRTNYRLVIVFEGRDASGKGGIIKRITAPLNPRGVRHVALPAPNNREKTQWYFQRYVDYLPAAGEIVIFDRSWYNRAGVERVMGFCTEEEYWDFLKAAPQFEQMLINSGINLLKYWLSVSDEEQVRRFKSRASNPTRRWKLSPIDINSITKWIEYSRAKDIMFEHTDNSKAMWYQIESDDKRLARLNVIRHLLDNVPYEEILIEPINLPDRPEDDSNYVRPPRDSHLTIKNYYEDKMEEE
jgi:polyphosphate kinase 2